MSYTHKVEVNGIDITNVIISWTVIKDKNDPNSNRAIVNATTDIGSYVSSFDVGLSIKVYKGSETATLKKIFSGTIDKFDFGGGQVVLTCRDPLYNLRRRLITKSFDKNIDDEGGVISAIAESLIVDYGELSARVTDSGSIYTLDKFICNDNKIAERLYVLAKILNWQVYWDDETEEVVFEPEGTTEHDNNLQVGINVFNTPLWIKDKTDMVNKIKLKGAVRRDTKAESFSGNGSGDTFQLAYVPKDTYVEVGGVLKVRGVTGSTADYDYTVDEDNKYIIFVTAEIPPVGVDNVFVQYTTDIPVPVIVRNAESIDSYDLQEDTFEFDDVRTVADATLKASNLLAKIGMPFNRTKLLVAGEYDLKIAMKVHVIDVVQGKELDMTIQKLTYSFPNILDELEVGDSDFQLAEFLSNIDARIRELEKRESVNIDLLTSVLDFNRTITTDRRYYKVQHRDVSMDGAWGLGFGNGVDDNTLTWGEVGALWQGSYTEAATDNLIIPGGTNPTFKEYFYDSEFRGSGAYVDTTNKKIIFPSGSYYDVFDNATAYYKFDDATDSIGTNDVTVTGPIIATGKIGNCYSFDGTDDVITFPVHLPRPTGSLNLWCYPTFAENDGVYHTLICDAQSSNAYRFSLAKKDDNLYRLEIYRGSGGAVVDLSFDDSYVPQNTWSMITITWTANDVNIYVNNTLRGNDNSCTIDSGTPSEDLRLGLFRNGLLPWAGKIDEFCFWDRVITSDERTQLYNSGTGITYVENTFYTTATIAKGVDFNYYTLTLASTSGTLTNEISFDGGSTWETAVLNVRTPITSDSTIGVKLRFTCSDSGYIATTFKTGGDYNQPGIKLLLEE